MTQPQNESASLTNKTDTKPAEVKVVCPTADEVVISYGPQADETAMTAKAIATLKEICSKACISSVMVTSTARTATDQARIMYDMIKDKGATYAKTLYAANGDKVVEVYENSEKKKLSADDTKKAMVAKINEVGPSNVSKHIVSDDGKLCVFDVAPSSITSNEAKKRFINEAKAHASVAKFLEPPEDPAYHLEITN